MKLIKSLIIFLMLFNLSCITIKGRVHCLEHKNMVWSKEDLHSKVRNELEATLKDWIDKDIKAVRYYKKTLWKVDETVFFNSKKDAAVLLVLEQDTAINAKMDDIHMIYAKNDDGNWRFFYKSMPALSAGRYYQKENPSIPYTFEELSGFAKKKLIKGGYLKKFSCKINDEWVNGWYSKILEGKHEEFLNNE